VIVVLLIFTLWAGNIKPAIAGYYIVEMLSTQNIEKGMDYFQKALDSWMNKYEAREHFSQKMGNVSFQSIKEADRPTFQKAFEIAEAEMEKSCQENPLDLRPHLFAGKLYSIFFQFSGDKGKLAKAEEKLQESMKISPNNQQPYWYLAEVRLGQGRSEEAIALLKKAIDLEPRYGQSYWYLTMAYKILGQYHLALESLAQAEKAGYYWQGTLKDIKEAIKIYLALNDDAHLVPLYLKAIEMDSKDVQLWASLAASYANLGQFDKAREAAQKVSELDPSSKSKIDDFLRSLP